MEINCDIRDNDALRGSFNSLTREVFGFDFEDWHRSGGWGNMYIPHAVVDNGEVVANVSVNIIPMSVGGAVKNYIQLGTVMTRPDRRGEGLGRYALEYVLEKYKDCDGIYLFANDSVLGYYPKFGFRPSREYSYGVTVRAAEPYRIEKADMSDEKTSAHFYDVLARDGGRYGGFSMVGNDGLYKFWIAAEYGDSVYFLPELNGYVIADTDGETLFLRQNIGCAPDPHRIAASFGMARVEYRYTPSDTGGLTCSERKEDDTTLFIMGDDLSCIERGRLMFPEISHA